MSRIVNYVFPVDFADRQARHAEVRVEYSLTPKGMRFGDLIMPVIAHLRIWDLTHGKA